MRQDHILDGSNEQVEEWVNPVCVHTKHNPLCDHCVKKGMQSSVNSSTNNIQGLDSGWINGENV